MFTQCLTKMLDMREKSGPQVDPEDFHHIVASVKSIATARPQHIVNFEYPDNLNAVTIVEAMCTVFHKMVQIKPKNPYVVSVDHPGKFFGFFEIEDFERKVLGRNFGT